MRLTQKANKENEHLKMCIGWYELPTQDYHVRVINETPNQMYQKLGQLEDIEEKYNIKSIDELDNRLKALEIVREKVMPLVILENETGRYEIYDSDLYMRKELTKKEYDLLKEVSL